MPMLIKSKREQTAEHHDAATKPPGAPGSFFAKIGWGITNLLGYLPMFTSPVLSIITYAAYAARQVILPVTLPLGIGAVIVSVIAKNFSAKHQMKQAQAARTQMIASMGQGQGVGVAHPGMVAGIQAPAGVRPAGGGMSPQYLPNNVPEQAGRYCNN